ncbi:MAG: hypothetical protein KA004_17250 [Verrucomicrobiales bacterium]|nr:hypothetical protein [Verrucomicrobiales bacterium]
MAGRLTGNVSGDGMIRVRCDRVDASPVNALGDGADQSLLPAGKRG